MKTTEPTPLGFRIGCADLEMSNLNADYGIILCGSVKEIGNPQPHTIRIDDGPFYRKRPWDDSWVAEQLRDLIEQFDLFTSWNGVRFDIPFLNTRLVKHGKRITRKILHKDLLFTSRFHLKLSSNRLANVQEFFNLTAEKTRIDPEHWNKAMTGQRESIDYIVDHCQRDVAVLEEVFYKLKPFIKEIKA